MSMITDRFGNKGFDRNMDKKLSPDEIDIRASAAGGYGQKIHTLQQEQGTDKKGMPNVNQQMWVHYDLQNKCDTKDVELCGDNNNCIRHPSLDPISAGTKDFLKKQRKNVTDPYWKDKWDTSDVCGWEGITCDTIDDKTAKKKYITKIDHTPNYFNFDFGNGKSMCYYTGASPSKSSKSQNEWVQDQSQYCESLGMDKACDDNQFCLWKDETEKCYDTSGPTDILQKGYKQKDCTGGNLKWKIGTNLIGAEDKKNYGHFYKSDQVNKGTCSLKPEYKKLSGLNKNDEFKTGTLSDVLGNINNGRVSDVKTLDNVQTTKRGDVLMRADNQSSAVKGIVEETALSKIFLSPQNTEVIQQTIRFRVFKKIGGPAIGYQSPEELYIVMRSVLLQHGNFKVSSKDVLSEIQKLNQHVVIYCVNEVSSNVRQYKGYLKDLEKLPTPIDRPSYNDSGSRNRTYDMSKHIAV